MANKKEYELLFKIGGALSATFKNSMQGAAGAMKGLAASAKALGQTQKDISAFKKTTEQLGSNREKLAELTAEHERLKAAIDGSTQPSERLLSQLARNEKQIDKVNAAIIKEENELNRLQNSLTAAGVNTSNLDQKNRELAADYEKLAKVQKELTGIQKAQADNNAAIGKTGASLAKTVAAGGIAATAVWQMALKPAADFEHQMAAVGSITQASGDELAKMTELAKQMGRTTSFSATEAGKAMEYAAMAGWEYSDMQAGLPGIINLAAASGEDLATVCDIVTDQLSAFGMETGEAQRMADVMAAASSKANTNVATMGETFKYVGPVLGAFKMSIEDAALATGLMANSSVKGSMAGTSLKATLNRLVTPNKESAMGIAKVAEALGQASWSATNADGSIRPLKDILKDLRTAFNNMSDAEKGATAKMLAGMDAEAGLLTLTNASEKSFNDLAAAIKKSNGVAEKMAKQRLSTLNGQITLLKSSLEGVQIEVGTAFIPALTSIVREITPVVASCAEWAGQHPELIKGVIALGGALIAGKAAFLGIKLAVLEANKAYLAGKEAMTVYKAAQLIMKTGNAEAAAAISPVGKAMGGLMAKIAPVGKTLGGFFAKMPGMIGKAVTGLMGAIAPLAASFAGFIAPLLPIIAAVAAVAAGFYLLYQNSEQVHMAVDGLMAAFSDGGAQIWEQLQSLMARLSAAMQSAKEAIAGFVASFADGAVELWNNVQPALAELAANVFPLLQQAGQFAGEALVEIFQALGAVAQIVFPLIEAIVAGAIGNITIVIQSLTGVFTGIIEFLTGVFTGDLNMALEGIKGVFTSVFEGIKNIVSNTINFIGNGISNLLAKAKEITGIGGGGGASVPAHATGSKNTEEVFIAGENGAELIVGRPNCTVFTAGETASIFAAMRARAGAAAGGGMPVAISSPAVAVASAAPGGGDTYNINITSAPTITGNGGTVENLQDHARELARMVMEEIEAIQSRRGRLAYGGL